MNQYTAWMVDLKGSREYELSDRSDIQNHISEVCGVLNRVFEPSLLHRVAFSAGDELQGLFRMPSAAYCCARLFRMLLWPAQVPWRVEKAVASVRRKCLFRAGLFLFLQGMTIVQPNRI